MKKYTIKVTYTVYDYYEVLAENEDDARELAKANASSDSLNEFHELSCQTSVEEVTEATEEDTTDPLAEYSNDYRKGIAYVMENLDEDDKAIIRAECNKAYKMHLIPNGDIVDDAEIIDLLEEYGADNDLPEGWYLEEYDADEVLAMI